MSPGDDLVDAPVPLPGIVASRFAGLYAYSVTGLELINCQSTQRKSIEVSVLEVLVQLNWLAGNVTYGGTIPGISGKYLTRLNYPLTIYRCKDGVVQVTCNSEDQWERLVVLTERTDILDDPRFQTRAERGQNAELLDDALQPWFLRHTCDEASTLCQEMRVPCSSVRSIEEARTDTAGQSLWPQFDQTLVASAGASH